jgi:hypothetical protein
VSSASIMLDLARAVGDDPSSTVVVLTPRQREAITLHLLHDMPAKVVAKEMGIEWRVVYLIVKAGLQRILTYLQSGVTPPTWQPWQLDYLRRNANLPRREIGDAIGRSENAVGIALSKMRREGKLVNAERYGGRVVSEGPQTEQQRAS